MPLFPLYDRKFGTGILSPVTSNILSPIITPSGGPPVAATGAIEFTDVPDARAAAVGSITWSSVGDVVAGTTLTVGGKTYTFVVGSPGADEIQIAVTNNAQGDNIANRINTDTADTLCTAENLSSGFAGRVDLTANTPGAGGNSIPLSVSNGVGGNMAAGPFTGGADGSTLTVGGKTYTFVVGTAGANQISVDSGLAVQIASDAADIINTDTATTLCTAIYDMSQTDNLTANTPGAGGNSIPLSTTAAQINITPFSGGN